MKKLLLLIAIISIKLSAQNWFFMPDFWEVGSPLTGYVVYNIESFDMNKDGHLDVVVGNWNDTYVYYGGYGILDKTVDVKYTGRMLAICDYNGDGYKDMIAMHFTSFDSSRYDYNGESLFYWGSDSTALAIDTIADYSIPLPTLYPTAERFTLGYFTVGIQKGDLNGDGKTDLVFSSTKAVDTSGNIDYNGKICIYMGKNVPTDTTNYILIGQNYSAYLGNFVQVGNINGDKYDDLLFSSNLSRRIGPDPDSINYLHIFYGSENFKPILGNESKIYSSYVNPTDSTAGWFLRWFSVDDINDDGISDLVAGGGRTTRIHYGSGKGLDTIPSFVLADPDTNRHDFGGNGTAFNIGDFNKDGYNDFIMYGENFILCLGGPHLSNYNPYAVSGLPGVSGYPDKAIPVGDQNGDGVDDFAACTLQYYYDINAYYGFAEVLYGQNNIHTDIKDKSPSTVKQFELYQNYPNPFNPTTMINYTLPTDEKVVIKVYDILGREVAELVNGQKAAGKHSVQFDGSNLSSGIYLYSITAGQYHQTKKIMLVK